jgi:hypothetical protein
MNRQTTQVLQVGAFLAVAVIALDFLLPPTQNSGLPVLGWLGLGVVFFLAAATLIGIVAQGIPKQTLKFVSGQKNEDEFSHLAKTVEAGVWGGDRNAKRILSQHLQSLAIGVIAARTKLPKREILNLMENDPQAFRNIVHDEDLLRFLLDSQNLGENLKEGDLQNILLKIGS